VARGAPWSDPDFTPRAALAGASSRLVSGLGPWARIPAFHPDPALVEDGFKAEDIVQGSLGDCYLLSAFSVLAAHGGTYLDNLVLSRELNEAGAYAVRFWKNGAWREVLVDDTLPTRKDVHVRLDDPGSLYAGAPDPSRRRYAAAALAHSRSRREFWMSLLEKGYGKLYGSFEAINGGLVHSALTDLVPNSTGSCVSMLDADVKAQIRSGALWEKLKKWGELGYLMGAGSPSGSDTNVSDAGIVQGHAYAILRVAEESDARGAYQLLQLRNPWGGTEWKGAFSDADASRWTRRLRQRLAYDPDDGANQDGVFWMQMSDFAVHFEDIYVCKIFRTVAEGGPWYKYTAEAEWEGRAAGGCTNTPERAQWNPQWYVKPSRPSQVYVSVAQKLDVLTADKACIGVRLVRKGGKRLKAVYAGESVMDSGYCAVREMNAEGRVTPDAAPYTLFASTFEPGVSRAYIVTVYSDAPLEMTDGDALRRIPESVPAG
jgi:calpain-5